jgi:hypothetical protein
MGLPLSLSRHRTNLGAALPRRARAWGGHMNWRRYLGQALDVAPALALLMVLVMAFVWPSAAFADGAAVKCAPNEERAWLYDSVTSFNVEAKLKCGENVEVIGQENGYVKVRTANGTEGYLPASNLPKIPAAPDMPGTDAKPAEPQSLASLARAAAARRASAASAPAASAAPVAAPNAVPSSAVASVAAAPVAATPVAAAPVAVAKMVAPAPATSAASSAAPAPQPKTPVAAAPVPAQPATLTVSSTTASPAAAIPATANPAAAAASHAKAKAASKPATTTTTVTTSAKTPSVNAPAPANPTAPAAPRPATTAPLHVAAATPAPKAPSAQPAAAVADIYVGGTNSPTTMAKGAPKTASNAPMVRTVSQTSEDDDDSYLTRPKNESEDPSCQTYFSGYGLSPGQFKWLVENRVKKYPSICPAASPAMVDYVIIFTHDVDFFNYTMPAPVHYEAGGFSDWTPILQYDMSVVSHSDVDKSKREYVWVFHVKRGAYDPNKFSPHRRFQYTKIEGKYSKTVEDAFEFIGSQGAER